MLLLLSYVPVAGSAEKSLKPGWQEKWESTIEAARKEGAVVIITGAANELRSALSKAFKDKYGLNIEYITGRGTELINKIFTERRSGLYLSDLYLAGITSNVMQLKPSGALASIKDLLLLPDATDPSAYFDDEIPFSDKEGKYILYHGPTIRQWLVINRELVKPGEIKRYSDLLNPKWRGKIALYDPTGTGGGGIAFVSNTMLLGILTPEFHRQLAKHEPVIIRDIRQQVEWVARGKYPIALAPYPDVVVEFQKVGAPLEWVTPETELFLSGGAVNGISYLDRAPHPNAAKIFVNWFMTREGQTIWARSSRYQSARKDVPTDHLDPAAVRKPGVKYREAGGKEKTILEQEKFEKLSVEIYSSLLR